MIGIVFGKFFPPHNGHLHVIQHARESCEKLFIVVCANEGATPSGRQRSYWVQQLAPDAEVLLTDDLCDWHFGSPCEESCSATWAQRLHELLDVNVDLVFSSEEYGDAFASMVGARHIQVDVERQKHPVSATAIRENLIDNWQHLPRIVRAGLYRKVAIMGAESSGTTTLARDLAKAISAPWIAESGRTISWELAIKAGGIEHADWDDAAFWRVLRDQARAEVEAVHAHCDTNPGELGPWLVCDTDAIATVVWWERYLSTSSSAAWSFAQPQLADLYVVTNPADVEFHQDGLRDGEHLRSEMHQAFVEIAARTGRRFLIVDGSREERVVRVTAEMRQLEVDAPRFSR